MPLLLPQALWVKRTALRLPDAAPPWQARALPAQQNTSAGDPLRLLVLGESTVAGVGVADQSLALSGQLAQQWATEQQRPVDWVACGRNGARARDCLADLVPRFGLRSGLLDRDLRQVAASAGAVHIAFDLPMEARYLAEDGYHPSAQGYQLWAQGIVRQLGTAWPIQD